jgi:hypothetical protein
MPGVDDDGLQNLIDVRMQRPSLLDGARRRFVMKELVRHTA